MAELKAPETEIERLKKTGRNDSCPCGSGKKYKKCHLRDDEEAERAYRAKVQEEAEKASAAEEEGHEGHDHAPGAHPVEKAAPVASKPVPKGPAGAATANAQRSMPRKAQ